MNEGMNQCDKKAKKTRHREKISSLSGGKVATLRAQENVGKKRNVLSEWREEDGGRFLQVVMKFSKRSIGRGKDSK